MCGLLHAVDTPIILRHPDSVRTGAGRTVTFTVVTSGGLTYQWFGPGGVALSDIPGKIAGVGTPSLQILNVQFNDIGDYQVHVSNAFGSVDSLIVSLTIGK